MSVKELFTQPLDPNYHTKENFSFQPEQKQELGLMKDSELIEGVLRVGSAYLLSSLVDIDKKQQEILQAIESGLKKIGVLGPIKTAFPETSVVTGILDNIKAQYQQLGVDQKMITKQEVDVEVNKIGQRITQDLFRGEFDDAYGEEVTEDEKELALQLRTYIGREKPAQIARRLFEAVSDRAEDRAEVDMAHKLDVEYSGFIRRYNSIKRQKTNALYFVPDYVSTQLLMSGREREVLKNTAFSLQNDGLHIQRISGTGEDIIKIPWGWLSTQGEQKYGWLMFTGILENPDIIRQNLGLFRFLIPQVTNFVRSPHLAGIISISTTGRETRYDIATKDATGIAKAFSEVGNLVDNIESFVGYIEEQKQKQAPKYQSLIRPNKVKDLLPPGADIIPYERKQDETINYEKAKSTVDHLKQRTQAMINETAIKAAAHLDADGKPPAEYQNTIARLRARSALLDEIKNKLTGL